MRTLLGISENDTLVDLGLYFRGAGLLAILLIVGVAIFATWLYRREADLPKNRRMIMGVCQGLALLLVGLMLLEPVLDLTLLRPLKRNFLILIDSSASMARADLGTDNTRFDAARDALAEFALGEGVEIRNYAFDGDLRAVESLAKETPDGEFSRVGSAIDEAVARHAGQPIAGVLVFSDFAWAKGEDPALVAQRLGERGLPIYTVGLGEPKPPDVRVRKIIAPDVAFAGDRVPLRVQLSSEGFDEREVEITLSANGEAISSQRLILTGGAQFAEMLYSPPREIGSAALQVAVSPMTGETGTENNSADHSLRIIDDKIKVLYVEGAPRWEFRYLRWVLLRDPRLDVSFLMTQGDPQLAATSPRHIGRFPDDPAQVGKYDLVIIGDVPSNYFRAGQLDQVEKLVRESGGSLLMLAGPRGAPSTYDNTPVAEMLPVKLAGPRWVGVGGKHPVVTADGAGSPVTSLAATPSVNARIWAALRPLDRLADLAGAKPGATTLVTLSGTAEGERPYPLVAWQRFGQGKVMYVGTEDLWRMRLEVGDRYHARFWGQTIQFLALSRLLGENKPIALETERRSYSSGEQVRIFANVLNEAFEPIEDPSYSVFIERQDDASAPTELDLQPVLNSPGLYSGVFAAREDGNYLLRPRVAEANISNQREFVVKTLPMEMRETAMQADVASQIAELSGGKSLTLAEFADLPEIIGDTGPLTTRIRKEADLWDLPLLFLLVVALSGVEWYMRRRENLV